MLETEQLGWMSSISTLVPFVASLIMWRRLDRPMRILAWMFLLAVLFETTSLILYQLGAHNLWLLNFWVPVEYTCTILAFAHWQKNRVLQKSMRFSVPVFLAIVALNKLTIEPLTSIDSYSHSISGIVIILVVLVTFQRLITDSGATLVHDPRVWFSTAALIYHAGTLMIFTLGSRLMEQDMAAFSAIYNVHSVLNIMAHLLFAGGFLCRPRR